MRQGTWSEVTGCVALLCVATVMNGVLRADDEEDKRIEFTTELDAEAAQSRHWIGVLATPVAPALKVHLDIDAGLIVRHVVEESPADKAGIKEHDILLRFGTSELETLKDLIEAVSQQPDEEITVSVIRRGKAEELTITAEKRPTAFPGKVEIELHEDGDQDFKTVVRQWFDKESPWRVLTMGPGILADDEEVLEVDTAMPQNLKISIEKAGGDPAKITVQRDGKQWKTTEEELDELPDDVRPHVERMLGRKWNLGPGNRLRFNVSPPRWQGAGDHEYRLDFRVPDQQKIRKAIRERALKIAPQVEEVIEELKENREEIGKSVWDTVRRELEEVRREIRELREELEARKE